MLSVVLFFLFFSILLYVLLGGADYGAGILELFATKKERLTTKKTVYRVMGPVWEANHVWIIITIVILWVGFPAFYNVLVVYLHIPLTLMLLGITLRGIAFIFRHYDAIIDRSQLLYDWMFRVSSLVTPIFIGMTFGAMLSGTIQIEVTPKTTFYELYILPWFSLFPIMMGLFYAAICSFLSAVFLIAEVDTKEQVFFKRKVIISISAAVAFGLIIILIGWLQDIEFIIKLIHEIWFYILVVISALILIPMFSSIQNNKKVLTRLLAGIQVLLILGTAFIINYPYFIETMSGRISLLDGMASTSVLQVLAISLLIGGSIILPGLFHLFKSFNLIKILDKS